jgi:hypothetical protein
MKQIAPNYTYNKTTGVITFTKGIDRDQLLLIANATRNVIYYNFADPATTLQSFTPVDASSTTLTLNSSVIVASTAHANSDALVIYYEDQSVAVAVEGLGDDGAVLSQISSVYGVNLSQASGSLPTRTNGFLNDPWVYIPRLTMSHPDLGNAVFDGYYRFDGVNAWGNANPNYGNIAYLTRGVDGDGYVFTLVVHNETNDQEIAMAVRYTASPDFPTSMDAESGTLVSGSLAFTTEQRESFGVRVTNSSIPVNVGNEYTGPVQVVMSGRNAGSVASFTSTSSATIASSNINRRLLTIFNEGSGTLHILYGSGTASTTNYSVRLLGGDYLEIDKYAGQVNGIFASAGTARITDIT